MSNTIAFYCGGKKPILELLVAIHTLRQHYNGNITIALGKTSVPYVGDLLRKSSYGIEVLEVPGSENDTHVEQHWASRWRGLGLITHDAILHLDCDIVVRYPFDYCFDHIHPDPSYMTTFYLWQDGEDYYLWSRRHLPMFQKIDPSLPNNTKPLYFGFGLIGYRKGWPHFEEMRKLNYQISKDELCMNYVLLHNGRKGYKPPIEDPMRLGRAYYRMPIEDYNKVKIWHFAGTGSENFYMWWKDLWEMRKNKIFNVHDDEFLKVINPRTYGKIKNRTFPQTDNAGLGAPKKKSI